MVPDVLTAQAPMIGQLIGDRYRILRKIGEGGMGEVYVAEHVHIEKKVAIKLLRPEVLSNAEAVARFRQEARSASAIGHDNIIEIDDFGTLPDGRVYMAMEFLAGPGAERHDRPRAAALPRALDIMIQVGEGPRRRARQGHHPPRHEAGEHLRHATRKAATCRRSSTSASPRSPAATRRRT